MIILIIIIIIIKIITIVVIIIVKVYSKRLESSLKFSLAPRDSVDFQYQSITHSVQFFSQCKVNRNKLVRQHLPVPAE